MAALSIRMIFVASEPARKGHQTGDPSYRESPKILGLKSRFSLSRTFTLNIKAAFPVQDKYLQLLKPVIK